MSRETFGIIDKRPNGRLRARYTDPRPGLANRYSAPGTFATRAAARNWLAGVQSDIARGTWEPPAVAAARIAAAEKDAERKQVTLGDYAEKWITTRTNSRGEPLRPRTVESYEALLRPAGEATRSDREGNGGPMAALVCLKISEITTEVVRNWRAEKIATGRISQTSRAYDLMKSIFKTAVDDGIVEKNPCQIRGGSTASTGKRVEPPSDAELAVILKNIDKRYRALVALAAAGGLRWGEATELRAKDIAIERKKNGAVKCVRISVSRQVVRTTKHGRSVGDVKSLAGMREVAIFGEDAGIIAEQARGKIGDALLTSNHNGTSWLPQSAFWRHWRKATGAAGRPDLPFHGLRHYAGTRYAQTGATPRETMARLGHASTKAAMRYQHSGNRDDVLARRMAR